MRITSFLWQRCMKEKLNRQMEKHGEEKEKATWEIGDVKQSEGGRNKKVKDLAFSVVVNHLVMRRGSGATRHVSKQRMTENG